MFRRISNRHLRKRLYGWIRPKSNDNYNISHLVATIISEKQNLQGRQQAVAKYLAYAKAFKGSPSLVRNCKEMAKIEKEAIPHIEAHILYLQQELAEEQNKAIA